MNINDAERMSLIDDLMLEEIFSDDADDVEVGAIEMMRKSLEGAELRLRKGRMAQIRAQIDDERRNPVVLNVDADRMRAKLTAAANDPGMKMTLAARKAVEGGDDEEEGLLEDLAELERDEDAEKE
jgi:ABC-type phosphate transport system auxiliary subunit